MDTKANDTEGNDTEANDTDVVDIEVDRSEFRTVRVHRAERSDLAGGDACVRVDRFALTTNNVTYAVFGDALQYWDFFPADPANWGRIPVWGFGDVVESRADDVSVGERLYGYFPMSTEVTLTPGRSDERGFSDAAPHRAAMAGAYNRYARVAADPLYRADRENHQMLLYPLFFTSFLIDDFLVDNNVFGAEQVIVSSASSKTALGVAFLLHQRGGARVVGLTSPANAGFVRELGVYDDVLTYDDAAELDERPSAFVDVAGNRDVVQAVHDRLAAGLAHSMAVGGTHWEHEVETTEDAVPGPQPVFFFAPTQISKRSRDWGRGGLDSRVGEAWDRYAGWVDGWIQFHHALGFDAVVEAYRNLLDGRTDPRTGYICGLRD